jgi:hypothetical protein
MHIPALCGGGRDGDIALLASARACRGSWHRIPVWRPKRTSRNRSSEPINRLPGAKPWKISFSYGRALQDPALEAWHGRDENLAAGQSALYRRASCNGAASVGKYAEQMELESASADEPPHRRDWRDD